MQPWLLYRKQFRFMASSGWISFPCVKKIVTHISPNLLSIKFTPLIARSMGPTGPKWAPCWPHELCYLGCYENSLANKRNGTSLTYSLTKFQWNSILTLVWSLAYRGSTAAVPVTPRVRFSLHLAKKQYHIIGRSINRPDHFKTFGILFVNLMCS